MTLLFQPIDAHLDPRAKGADPASASLTFSNRLMMPPMCMYSAAPEGDTQGNPTDFHLVHYGARAQSVGTVVVEATGVVPEGRISAQCLSFARDDQIPAFSRLAHVIHAAGAVAGIQLNHAGRKAAQLPNPHLTASAAAWSPTFPDAVGEESRTWQTVGASPVPNAPQTPIPMELTVAQIDQVVDAFATAARRAAAAGFDFVQVHCAHGYLLHSFLSPASNQRTDSYGGSLENRARLVLRVLDAVRQHIPAAVRISATEWVEDAPSFTLTEAEEVAVWLAEHGAFMVNVSTGGNLMDVPIPVGPGYQVPAAAAIRAALHRAGHGDVLVGAVGVITSAAQAETIVNCGQADLIEVGRPLLADPMLGHRWRHDLGEVAQMPPQYERAKFAH